MLRVSNPQATVWDTLLPDEAKRLSEELTQVSEFLDEKAFIAPDREHFSQHLGRPSVSKRYFEYSTSSTAMGWDTSPRAKSSVTPSPGAVLQDPVGPPRAPPLFRRCWALSR